MSLTLRATPWNSSTWSGVSAFTLNRPLATSIWATKGAKFASPRAFSSALSAGFLWLRRYSWGYAHIPVMPLAAASRMTEGTGDE